MELMRSWTLYSPLFLLGPLLRTIQMSSLYKDSKTFVDKKLKYPAGKIIKNFETLVNDQDGELLSIEQIKQVGSIIYVNTD